MRILVIDCGWLSHRSKHAYQGLSHNGEGTGVVFGFFNGLADVVRERKPDRICFCWDGQGSYRQQAVPTYKANRNKEPTSDDLDAYRQMSLLRCSLLHDMGFKNIYVQNGVEADDIIAQVVRQTPDDERIVFSADRDLWQVLVDEHVFITQGRGKQMTLASFREETGLDEAWKWAGIKALAGCTSDNVIGLPGIGETTALKWTRGLRIPGKRGELLMTKGLLVAERNLPLTRLPHPATKPVTIAPDACDAKRIKQLLGRFGIESLVERDDWISILCRARVHDRIRNRLNGDG